MEPSSSIEQTLTSCHTIGIVVAKVNNEIFAKIVEHIQDELLKHDYKLIVLCSNYSHDKERCAILTLVNAKVDCIITLATRHCTVHRSELNGIPVIAIDSSSPIIDDTPDYRIWNDQYVGGILATEELIQKGCKRIAYFTNKALYHIDYKFKGYCDTLLKYKAHLLHSVAKR